MRRRDDIQGLRGLAILLVVLGHAGVPGFAGGFIGVDVFYVISGFVITGLLLGEHAATGSIRAGAFYARRLRRLLPALLLMLFTTLVVAAAVLTPYEVLETTASAGYAVTWSSNMYFAFAKVEYFAGLRAGDLFLHSWSLGVEEQFYLVWPWLLGAVVARGRDARWLRIALGTLGVASFAAMLWLDALRPAWAFYLMPTRIWQFTLGAAVACGLAEGARVRSGTLGLLGLVLVLGSATVLRADLSGAWVAVPSLGTSMLIASGAAGTEVWVRRLLAHPLAVWIGDRSYAWYLWHWPALMLATTLGAGAPAELAAAAAGALVLAAVSYATVERPLWKGRWRDIGAPRSVALASLLAMALAVGAVQRIPELVPAQAPIPEISAALAARGDVPALYRDGCDTFNSSADVRPCIYGDPAAAATVVLLGDSVAMQWYPLVAEAFAEGWRIVVLTKSACPLVDHDFYYARLHGVYRVCSTWRAGVLRYVRELRPQVIVAGSSADYDFDRDAWVEGSARVLALLGASARGLLVLAGTPTLPFDGPSCLERRARDRVQRSVASPATCAARMRADQDSVASYLREAVARVPNASLVDFNKQVCPDGWCAAALPDGTVVFRDGNHLTGSFVRRLSQSFKGHLAAMGLEGAPQFH